MTQDQAFRSLDSFAVSIPRLYPKPVLDYRGRTISAESVQKYLEKEKNRLVETVEMLPAPSHRGARLLDIGTAYGFLTALLKADGMWRCEGLELVENIPIYCAFAKKHEIPIHQGKLGATPLPFSDGSFDAIILSEVLEHLRLSPLLIFRELKRLLTKDGFLVVTTPNVARLTNILKLLLGRNPVEPFPNDVVSENVTEYLTHVREYTMQEVCDLLGSYGFTICQARYSNCMERHRLHGWLTALVPPWRGNLIVLAQKS